MDWVVFDEYVDKYHDLIDIGLRCGLGRLASVVVCLQTELLLLVGWQGLYYLNDLNHNLHLYLIHDVEH